MSSRRTRSSSRLTTQQSERSEPIIEQSPPGELSQLSQTSTKSLKSTPGRQVISLKNALIDQAHILSQESEQVLQLLNQIHAGPMEYVLTEEASKLISQMLIVLSLLSSQKVSTLLTRRPSPVTDARNLLLGAKKLIRRLDDQMNRLEQMVAEQGGAPEEEEVEQTIARLNINDGSEYYYYY